jgi:hypothetical protein
MARSPLALIGALFIHCIGTSGLLACSARNGWAGAHAARALRSVGQVRPRARESAVPALVSRVEKPRNIVFVILESVRADATCISHDPECKRTEATNQLLPKRFGFSQMRSMDSTTAVSLAVLWGGLLPNEDRETLHTWPLLFDYAHAAG